MTASEPEYEWGVEWTYKDGRSYVSWDRWSERGARLMVEQPIEGYEPRATRLFRRVAAGPGLPVPLQPEGQATT